MIIFSGQIYVHRENDSDKLNAMANILTETHFQVKPEEEDLSWAQGDRVIAKYNESDLSSWNRGVVTKVFNDSQVQVLYVDYGQTAILNPSNDECHKCLMFEGMVKICKISDFFVKLFIKRFLIYRCANLCPSV